MLDAYAAGQSVRRLATRYRVRTSVITKLLNEHDVELHPGGKPHPKLRTAEQCAQIRSEYDTGLSLVQLAERHGCSTMAIKNAIRRAGGAFRRTGRSTYWTPERIDWVVTQYKQGRSQASIGAEIGLQQTAISVCLQQAGVSTRRPNATKGRSHGSWKGGRIIDGSGYVRLRVTNDMKPYVRSLANNYVLEHRYVMGRLLGRPLRDDETVHHVNGDRTDNRPENLQIRQGRHGNGVVFACNACGSHDIQAREIAS